MEFNPGSADTMAMKSGIWLPNRIERIKEDAIKRGVDPELLKIELPPGRIEPGNQLLIATEYLLKVIRLTKDVEK